ncbi:MAG: hypothetical protein C0465_25250 [Ralstonia sp.]|nr:hypothetical protein [Ralstonia sp.]
MLGLVEPHALLISARLIGAVLGEPGALRGDLLPAFSLKPLHLRPLLIDTLAHLLLHLLALLRNLRSRLILIGGRAVCRRRLAIHRRRRAILVSLSELRFNRAVGFAALACGGRIGRGGSLEKGQRQPHRKQGRDDS